MLIRAIVLLALPLLLAVQHPLFAQAPQGDWQPTGLMVRVIA
jgi:hypothetical protein